MTGSAIRVGLRCRGLQLSQIELSNESSLYWPIIVGYSERARDQLQRAAVTPKVNLSFSFVSRFSIHVGLIAFIAVES